MQSLLDSPRVLLGEGAHPWTVLAMRHAGLPVLRAALLRHQQSVLADQADQPVARKSLAA
jgi:hypothetical protein